MSQDENIHDLLRFTTAGSVDDGKSTLIGRLLYDSKSIFEDQLEAIEKTTERLGREGVDLALLTDGLQAEREQGITIDVAYRYFATPDRKFIIADTPGHEQYTRNMVTGASTAELALILIDASKGLQPQSRRHAYISALLGIKHIMVCINKMDLVDYSQDVFDSIVSDFKDFVSDVDIPDLRFIPISALKGDNVVVSSERTPWYKGETVLKILETVELIRDDSVEHLRFPVQYVNRPNSDFRGYCGTVWGGKAYPGQKITALPSGKTSKIKSIIEFEGELQEAVSPQAVTITLEDEIDISRGDIIVSSEGIPETKKEFTAKVCWMSEDGLQARRKYILKQCSKVTKAMISGVDYKMNVDQLQEIEADSLELNDIGQVKIKVMNELAVEPYILNHHTGSFILIDETTQNTVAAGMIV